MRLPMLLLGFTAVFATAALGEDDCRCWTPDAQQVADAEAAIASHQQPLVRLDRYVRYYAGTIRGDHRLIRGKLVPVTGDAVPGVHIVEGQMPPLQGDGCVTYSQLGNRNVGVFAVRSASPK
jgi:hypothetical protein